MKIHFPLTRRGIVLVGISVMLVFGGFLLGDVWLVLLGLCGGVLVIAAFFLAWVNLRSMEVAAYCPRVVRAGGIFEFEVSLRNRRRWWDGFLIDVVVSLPGKEDLIFMAPWTAAESVSTLTQSVVLPVRALKKKHPVSLSSSFPLGLFRMSRELCLDLEITVTPRRIHPLELSRDGSLHDTQPRGGVTVGQSFGEPRGVRPWQAGDAARRIHWPASIRAMARGHDLRVREYDPPGFHPERSHLVFHSYASGGEMLLADRFERAISLLVGALVTLQANGITCQLTADFNDWVEVECSSRLQLAECLGHLAGVRRCSGTEAHDLENALSAVPSDEALMILSDMPPESWSHLLVDHPHTLVVDVRQIRYQGCVFYGATT